MYFRNHSFRIRDEDSFNSSESIYEYFCELTVEKKFIDILIIFFKFYVS